MKNKLIVKFLLIIVVIGIIIIIIVLIVDVSEGYGLREKKLVSINYNIVEYNDGIFKY